MTGLTSGQALQDFIVDGANSVFENRRQHARVNKYWPLFLSEILKAKRPDDFDVMIPLHCMTFAFLLTVTGEWI